MPDDPCGQLNRTKVQRNDQTINGAQQGSGISLYCTANRDFEETVDAAR